MAAPAKVGIDYYPAVSHWPGAGRYARELVRALALLPDGPELHLADLGRHERVVGEPALGLDGAPARVRLHRSRLPRRALDLLARAGRGADVLAGGVDLFHRVLPDRPPVTRAVVVQTVLELPPEGTPEDRVLGDAVRRAEGAVVFSGPQRAAVAARYGLAPERVHLVPPGADHWVRGGGAPPPRKDPPQIAVLGTLRPRRRPAAVLRAVEELKRRRRPCRLFFVGSRGGAEGKRFLEAVLGSSTAREWVLVNELARDEEIGRILAASSLLVHLAEEEETAVTPLEAFAAGVPVVASQLPALEEALGGEALLVEREVEDDPDALAAALDRALASASDEEAAERRRRVASAYTWERCAAATLEVWRSVLPA